MLCVYIHYHVDVITHGIVFDKSGGGTGRNKVGSTQIAQFIVKASGLQLAQIIHVSLTGTYALTLYYSPTASQMGTYEQCWKCFCLPSLSRSDWRHIEKALYLTWKTILVVTRITSYEVSLSLSLFQNCQGAGKWLKASAYILVWSVIGRLVVQASFVPFV